MGRTTLNSIARRFPQHGVLLLSKSIISNHLHEKEPKPHLIISWHIFYVVGGVDTIFKNYQERAQKIYEQYMRLYHCENPHGQNSETASLFLNQHYKSYREDFAALTIDVLATSQFDKDILRKILDENGNNIIRLYHDIQTTRRLLTLPINR
jgi:hypothetical protein